MSNYCVYVKHNLFFCLNSWFSMSDICLMECEYCMFTFYCILLLGFYHIMLLDFYLWSMQEAMKIIVCSKFYFHCLNHSFKGCQMNIAIMILLLPNLLYKILRLISTLLHIYVDLPYFNNFSFWFLFFMLCYIFRKTSKKKNKKEINLFS